MSIPLSMDHTSWAIEPYPWREAERLASSLGLPLVAAMVLAGRRLADPVQARRFLDGVVDLPDPFLFADMEAAVALLSEAVDQGRRIVIHGDYDADGITATAVMLLGLRDLGVQAEWYLPSRFNEGYGLSRRAVEAIAGAGPALLITVDCGVNYPEEVAYAQHLGLDVIVVDHHRPGPVLPGCHLIHEVAGEYPHGDLCGVGLALKVLHALHVRRSGAERKALPEPLLGLLDLVAIGTIADLAALRGENRYYVKEGLKLIGIGQRLGLRVLCSVAGCTGVVDSGTVAFRLAPRLNAAGRLADPSPPLRLLLSDDEKEATALAARLHELNGARQDVERQILEEAVKQVEDLGELPPALVLAGREWHEGVVGIVASRLVERYNRPTVLLGVRDGVAKGSGRSISAYDLMGGLNACAEWLTVYGGHKQAVGLTLEAGRVDDFSRALEAHAGVALESEDLAPVYRADAILRGEDVDSDTATALASLGPFGSGNPRPRLLLVGAEIQQAEATRNGAHLRCVIDVDGVRTRGIGFGMGDAASALLECPGPRIVGAQLRVDEWQGTLRPEFLLERVGPVGDYAGPAAGSDGGCGYVRPAEPAVARGEDDRGPQGPGSRRLPTARDRRGAKGTSTVVAQILASEGRALLVACSASQAVSSLRERIPLYGLWGRDVRCAARGSQEDDLERLIAGRVAVVEWEVASAAFGSAGSWTHVVVLQPPYRNAHVAFLHEAEAAGSLVHLCYGEDERRETAKLLRYLVHPRFAMVCLYRAMQEGEQARIRLFARAAEIGWQEGGVVVTWDDLLRASSILDELRVDPSCLGEAKLDARNVSAYTAAEADYEECSKLCLTL